MKTLPQCLASDACGLWTHDVPRDGTSSNNETIRVEGKQVVAEQLERHSHAHYAQYHSSPAYARLGVHAADEVEPPDESAAPTHEEARSIGARLTSSLYVREHGAIRPGMSVYWAVVILPQISRSCHWPKMLTRLCLRSYIFLIVNLIVQGTILIMIAKEEMVEDLFAGQMYLCDFGAFVEDKQCPENHCIGPAGTNYETSRIYRWKQWVTRTFLKSSLQALFPEKAEEIDSSVDPDTYWMLRLFIAVPTHGDSWVLDKESSRPSVIRLYQQMHSVRLRIAGMPWQWKIFNFIFVWLPKALVWKLTAQAGITFLMETGGIEEIIINSVALTFILGIDEIIFQNLMALSTKTMLSKVESYPMNRTSLQENVNIEELVARYEQQFEAWTYRDFFSLIPMKLVGVCLLTCLFVFEYYYRHCKLSAGSSIIGGFVSKEMYRPVTTELSFQSAFFPNFFPVPLLAEKFWSMPPNEDS